MNKRSQPQGAKPARSISLSPKTIIGIIIAVLLVIFVVMNRERTSISFIFFTTDTALWIALTVAAVGGFLAGFLVSRQRYRP